MDQICRTSWTTRTSSTSSSGTCRRWRRCRRRRRCCSHPTSPWQSTTCHRWMRGRIPLSNAIVHDDVQKYKPLAEYNLIQEDSSQQCHRSWWWCAGADSERGKGALAGEIPDSSTAWPGGQDLQQMLTISGIFYECRFRKCFRLRSVRWKLPWTQSRVTSVRTPCLPS